MKFRQTDFYSFLLFFLMVGSFHAVHAQPNKGYAAGTQNPKPAPKYKIFNLDSFYQKKEWVSPSGDTLRYRILFPENYNPAQSYPLLVFLHGAGERGADNQKQLTHGAQLFLQPANRTKYPTIIVFPQCAENDYWSNVQITMNDSTQKRAFNFQEAGDPTRAMQQLMNWLPELENEYKISKGQRYIMGLSMGGMGTFELLRRKPDYFAAAIPICGGANLKTAKVIKQTPLWMFHGMDDDVVSYHYSEDMYKALQEFYVRAEATLTLYSKTKHNSWDPAFAEPDLLSWLFSQKK